MITGAVDHLTGNPANLIWVVVKALLLYVTAVLGFRLGERRTLAEMSAFDFVAAVAVGAIVGRVPNSDTTSYLYGAATLVTILFAHAVIARLRYFGYAAAIFDHPPRLLVKDSELQDRELKRSGLTRDDVFGILRQHGITELKDVDLVIFEQRGKISVVRRAEEHAPAPELVRDVLASAGELKT